MKRAFVCSSHVHICSNRACARAQPIDSMPSSWQNGVVVRQDVSLYKLKYETTISSIVCMCFTIVTCSSDKYTDPYTNLRSMAWRASHSEQMLFSIYW